MRRIANLLTVLALVSCGDDTPPAPPQPVAQPRKGELTEQQSADCVQYGMIAGRIAVDRDNGVTIGDELATIRKQPGLPGVKADILNMAHMVYENPAFNRQEPKSEAMSWTLDCDLRLLKKQAGAKAFNTDTEITEALAGFKTFDGTPLIALLGKYGIRISYVEETPAEVFDPVPYEKGDLVFLLQFSKGASRAMPCHLRTWFKGDTLPIPEFIRRGAQFPLIRPEEVDPVIYWAATGKCTEAYSL